MHEVFHAHFVEHRYPPHVHDTWTILLVDIGAVRYDLSIATAALTPPLSRSFLLTSSMTGTARRGRASQARPVRRHRVLPEALIGAAVDRPAINDDRLIADLSRLHRHLVDR